MTYTCLLTEHSDNILTVTLNRPEKLNALTPTLLSELKSILDDAADRDDVSVVVINSTGKAFCVGYDLNAENWVTSQYPADHPNGVDYDADHKDIDKLLDYWLDMWRFPKPIIVAVQGACLSGANELLAVSDLVIANDKAVFGHPAGRDLGIPPTVFLWPLTIGMRKTKEMLFTARNMTAVEAEKLGLINQVVEPDRLDTYVRDLALDIAKTPANHLMILKQSTNNFYDNMNMEKSMRQASKLDADFHQSPTFLAFFKLVREKGMKAALAERRRRFG